MQYAIFYDLETGFLPYSMVQFCLGICWVRLQYFIVRSVVIYLGSLILSFCEYIGYNGGGPSIIHINEMCVPSLWTILVQSSK
jgi:hypothetical protein